MFQKTSTGFDEFWGLAAPTVEKLVSQRLRKHLVRGRHSLDDEDAVQEAIQMVAVRLLELPGKPNSWFDPTRGSGGVDALKAWLHTFASHAVADFCRMWRGSRNGVKVIADSAFPLNELSEARSAVETAVAKIVVDDWELRAIVNECMAALSEDLRSLTRLNIWDDLSERAIAASNGWSVSRVHRGLDKARTLLARELGNRGVDLG